MDDNVTLHVPETRAQYIELGFPETTLNTLVSTMRNEGWFEKLISDTRDAYIIFSKLQSSADAKAREGLSALSSGSLEQAM